MWPLTKAFWLAWSWADAASQAAKVPARTRIEAAAVAKALTGPMGIRFITSPPSALGFCIGVGPQHSKYYQIFSHQFRPFFGLIPAFFGSKLMICRCPDR